MDGNLAKLPVYSHLDPEYPLLPEDDVAVRPGHIQNDSHTMSFIAVLLERTPPPLPKTAGWKR